jgi:hypothetical protein
MKAQDFRTLVEQLGNLSAVQRTALELWAKHVHKIHRAQ